MTRFLNMIAGQTMRWVLSSIASLVLTASGALHAHGEEPEEQPVPAETQVLCDRWLAAIGPLPTDSQAAGREFQDLVAAPDADLCLLNVVSERSNRRGSIHFVALNQLIALNTPRTYDILLQRAASSNRWQRRDALQLLGVYNRPECIPTLLDVLEHDPYHDVKLTAIEALNRYRDPRIEPALLRAAESGDEPLALYAGGALSLLNSQEGLKITLRLLEQATTDAYRDMAIRDVGNYRWKAAVEALLREYDRLLLRGDDRGESLRKMTLYVLDRRHAITKSIMDGPKEEALEKWRAWWSEVEPQLNDDLTLKMPEPVAADQPIRKPVAIHLEGLIENNGQSALFDIVMEGFDHYYYKEWRGGNPRDISAIDSYWQVSLIIDKFYGGYGLSNGARGIKGGGAVNWTEGPLVAQVARRLWSDGSFGYRPETEFRSELASRRFTEEFRDLVNQEGVIYPRIILWRNNSYPDLEPVRYTITSATFSDQSDLEFFEKMRREYFPEAQKPVEAGPAANGK